MLLPLIVILVDRHKPQYLHLSLTRKTSQVIFAEAVRLAYLRPNRPLQQVTNAPKDGVVFTIRPVSDDTIHPLGFFTVKQPPAHFRYNTFSWEIMGIFEAICQFQHIVNGR